MSQCALDQIVMPPFCTEFPTPTGNPMKTPVVDDFSTSNSPASIGKSYILSENTLDTDIPINTSQVPWGETPKFSSGSINITTELMDDAQYGIENAGTGSCRSGDCPPCHAIGLGQAMITGLARIGGLTANLPSSTAITSASSTLALADLSACMPNFRFGIADRGVWYMHDNTRLALHKLLESSSLCSYRAADAVVWSAHRCLQFNECDRGWCQCDCGVR